MSNKSETRDARNTALAALPSPATKRWVARRKAAVVAAVADGLLTLDEACRRYTLSTEEFAAWQQAIDSHGLRGLRTTRLQDYRVRRRKTDAEDDGAATEPLAAAPRVYP